MRVLLTGFLSFCIYWSLGCNNIQKQKNYFTKHNLTGDIKELTEFEYNAISKFGKPEKDTLEKNTVQKFDNGGKLVEENKYEMDGRLERKIIYSYDINDKEVEQKAYGMNGNLIQTYFSKYDKKGLLVDWKNMGSNGSLYQGHSCTYDMKNNLIEINNYDNNGVTTKDNYNNDNNGKPVEMLVYNKRGDLVEKHIYAYDVKSNLSERTIYSYGVRLEKSV